MIGRNVTEHELTQAMRDVNKEYGRNLRFKNGPTCEGRGFRFTLTVNTSAGQGGRRSNTGRKIAAACWHAHRDYFRALYKLNPSAVIKSALATYEGSADFEAQFEATGDRNIGSAFEPQSMRTACECSENDNPRAVQAEQRAYEDAQRRMSNFI